MNLPRSLRAPSLALAAALALAGAARADVTETIVKTFPLAADGTVSLDNVNGDIEIVAWDKAEVAIEAVKKARDAEAMDALRVHFDSEPGRLAIRTEYVKRSFRFKGDNRSVRYTLKVPADATLRKIDSVNSNITVEDVRGPVHLETVNGRIRASGLAADGDFDTVNGSITASFHSAAAARKIVLDTVNGSCTLMLPADAGGRVKASSVNGSITCDIPVTLEKSGRRSLRGTIGRGDTEIVLDSVNGSLRIAGN